MVLYVTIVNRTHNADSTNTIVWCRACHLVTSSLAKNDSELNPEDRCVPILSIIIYVHQEYILILYRCVPG